ncbi:protein DEK-like [Diabrotica virgifera virgifera]|uniref:Uncharacterized protein n=1 Tax=Diabrotica virgifera virgifera TaxID=50390 RepID=A0ABM5L7C5_DIAVI|nr:protein DEK-like [Diabrotica virgifera virgifera]
MDRYLENKKCLDSDETTDDGTKRRTRDEGSDNEEERSTKSRKLSKTSSKTIDNHDETKLDKLIDMMNILASDIKEIRRKQNRSNEAIERLIADNQTLREENKDLKKENMEIKKELNEVKETIEFMEKQRRKNNVVMSGLAIRTYDQSV